MSSSATPTSWAVKLDGPQVERLKDQLRLPAAAADQLVLETSEILGLCGPPTAPASAETGLALGYVQSGKTMSFTSLIAMARDNGYQVIIVLAGTQTVLVNQSVQRLTKDLQLGGINSRDWRIVPNPTVANGLDGLKTTLDAYKSGGTSRLGKRTAIVAVMKNKLRLESLIKVVEQLQEEFKGAPTLIVDDEADQAGMNNEARANRRRVAAGQPKKLSPVYTQLLRLKNALPHHTYVQYTATPQALLFIERQDDLSPNFIKLLTPGAGYTGGKQFFSEPHFKKLVKEIPESEVASLDHSLASAPSTLQEALRVYFLGAADYLIQSPTERNRSMMVHPSQRTDIHRDYYNWVTTLKATWERLLKKPTDDADRQELLAQFKSTYFELQSISTEIAPFDELLDALLEAISSTQVKLLNAAPGSAPQIDWVNHEFFILVGGQAMSRGFTVEGLTVTYMPRSLGTGTADTMQQWARFFGYKKKYLHLCRIYLIEEVIDAFLGYVRHESDLHDRLKSFDAGRMLNDFQRRVELPSSLSYLTRSAVLSDDVERYRFGGTWITTVTVQGSAAEIKSNRAAIQAFIKSPTLSWQPDKGSEERTEAQIHLTAKVSLTDMIKLLRSYTYLSNSDADASGFVYLSTDDINTFDMLAGNLEKYSKANPSAMGVAYQMSPQVQRKRTSSGGKLKQGPLFQGRNPSKESGKAIYPGDMEIKDKNRFSLQIHSLKVKEGKGPEFDSFVLAVWVPSEAGVEMVKLAED